MIAFKHMLTLFASFLIIGQLGALAKTLSEICTSSSPPQSCMFVAPGIKVSGNGIMQSGFASDGKTMLYAIDDRGSSGNLDGCGGSVIWAFDYDSRLGTNEFDARYQAKGGKLAGWFTSNPDNKVSRARVVSKTKGDDLHVDCSGGSSEAEVNAKDLKSGKDEVLAKRVDMDFV